VGYAFGATRNTSSVSDQQHHVVEQPGASWFEVHRRHHLRPNMSAVSAATSPPAQHERCLCAATWALSLNAQRQKARVDVVERVRLRMLSTMLR
jgi:hypothetical protein